MCFKCSYLEFIDLIRTNYGYSVVQGNYYSDVERRGLIDILTREKFGVISKSEKDIIQRHIVLGRIVKL